ncbi:MAG TPA: hypothetical protein VN317_04670 [Candidatus Methanoperedens sp.]|nr:hypothetical protein [Candidatus Methanoperedens sp.]
MKLGFPAVALLAAALVVAPSAAGAADEQFSFYGLQFGITKAEAGRRLPLTGTIVRTPGHGMSELELLFDREDLLMEIRAGWPKPEDPLEQQGLLRALRERFVSPTTAKFPAIAVTLDEYSNRAAVRVVFLATNIREKNIEFHKNRLLKTFE